MKKTLTVIFILFSCTLFTTGQIFKQHHIITTGSVSGPASSIEIVDLNNNGEKDILACSKLHRYIYMLTNKDNNEFEVIRELPLGYNLELNNVGSGDIDNDGLKDIVYSKYDYGNQLGWFKNFGNGEFGSGGNIFSTYFSGWRSVDFSVIDLNGDNCVDVVIGCDDHESYNLEVRINQCNGEFDPAVSVLDTGQLYSYTHGDLNMDGFPDLVYISEDPYRLIVAINNGSGEFTEKVRLDTNYYDLVNSIHLIDTDLDNDLDILGLTQSDSIPLFLNEGGNEFTRILTPMNSPFSFYKVRNIDIDNDGDQDIINRNSDILLNTGNNRFEYVDEIDFPFFFSGYQICDLNSNGVEDIVFGVTSGGIGYIEDASIENYKNWRFLTSQVLSPHFPAYEKINDDTLPDICILDSPYKNVFYLNSGKSEFKDTIRTDKLHIYSSEQILFFDIDKDGFCDIASFYDPYGGPDSNHFKLARNNGNNSFDYYDNRDFDFLEEPYVYFTDYNNDSILNAILTSEYGYSDSLLILDINPDFSISPYDTLAFDQPFVVKEYLFWDVDKNGQNDLLLRDYHTIFVTFSEDGSFGGSIDTVYQYDEYEIDAFAIGNINQDSACDIVITANDKMTIIENFNGSSYEQVYTFDLEDWIQMVFLHDVNKDGIDEIFCATQDKLLILKEVVNGSYSQEGINYKGPHFNYKNEKPFIFTDIDLDGDEDLLATCIRRADLSWFENALIDTIGYDPFPTNNTIWTELHALPGDSAQTWTSLYAVESDTLIIGQSYRNIFQYYIDSVTYDTIRQLFASIRQDILEKSVYIIRHYLSESKEKLLLDFRANVGDTVILDAYYWDLYPQTTDSVFILDSITTTTIFNGEERDHYHFSNHNEETPVALSIIEGVGSIINPFGPTAGQHKRTKACFQEYCCPKYLICLTVDDEAVYVKNNESECNELRIWSSSINENINRGRFKIYPNPASNIINIKLDQNPSSDYVVKIYNHHGIEIAQLLEEGRTLSQSIDIRSFQPGLYYISIRNKQLYYSSKFVVIR